MRLRLDIAYDGTDFSGWAEQPARRTVAGVLSDSLARVLRLGEPPRLTVAGRTDAGVHATGQVAHVDLAGDVDTDELHRRLRGVLPPDVVVRAVTVVPDDFDARFSATARHYRYLISDTVADPLRRHTVLVWPRPLDAGRMHQAAQRLVGEHDFAAYCKHRPDATTRRRLLSLDVQRVDDLIEIRACGQAFCHNQVRSMVGALIAVGEGRREIDWPGELLRRGVRDSAVTVAPAHGLTLLSVSYPD